MPPIVFTVIGIAFITVLIGLIWRLSSKRESIPCPTWLGWLVELDNPILKENSARKIIPHLLLEPGMQVLDFGCGPGRLSIPAARLVAPDGRVTAFDIQAGMLERVRKKAVSGGLFNIDYLQGVAGDGKLGSNRYDRALLVTVLGEIPDKESLLREIYNSLKQGGLLVVTEAVADPHFLSQDVVRNAAKSAGFVEESCHGNKLAYTMVLRKPVLV